MANGRKCHFLLLYRAMTPSIRLCGHCQMEELARQGKAEYRACQELRVKRADLNWADVVLLGRLDSWYEYKLTKKLKEAGKYLIYIIDDDLLNIPPEISSAAYYGQTKIQEYIRGMIEISDAILSPSPILLEKYATNGRIAIQIEEPAIDPVPYKPHDPNKPVKIGFAGSIDRTSDIENILRDVLVQIKQEFGDRVQFEFFGAIPTFADEINAKCITYCDSYDEYRNRLNSLEWDIGLAPMPDTPFHACKHYNKFIEYAAAGIAGVFSDVQPYTRLHEKYFSGEYCENSADVWCEKLRYLIINREELEKKREEAARIVQEHLSIQIVSVQLKLFRGSAVLGTHVYPSCYWNLEVMKLITIGLRMCMFVKKYKFKAPMALMKKLKQWM